MAYTKTIWKDHLTEHQYRYKNLKTNEVVDLIPQEGTIFQEGTPINAEKLNNIEDGLEALYEKIFNLSPRDVLNLSAEAKGKINWSFANLIDNTRVSLTICRATKDITNMDYAACYEDDSVLKNKLIKTNTTYTYTDVDYSTKYWVKVFVEYVTNGISHMSHGSTVTFTVPMVTTFGVAIDTTNPNQYTAITYTNDAIGLEPMKVTNGILNWGGWKKIYEQLGIKPCLFKEGAVQYYLNPDDFSKKIDGSAADITSGADGDVMIEFGKPIYWKFSKINNTRYVQWSTLQIDDSYKALAHTVGTTIKSKIYIGAYLGYVDNMKMRSLSEKPPIKNMSSDNYRNYTQANGAGYQNFGFYQLLLLKILCLTFFKSFDSENTLGRGYNNGQNVSPANTGGSNSRGMFCGDNVGLIQMKFCGIEDLSGNYMHFADGILLSPTGEILISDQTQFNGSGLGYTNYGKLSSSGIDGYFKDVSGTNETGFIATVGGGSSTTYYGAWSNTIGQGRGIYSIHLIGDGNYNTGYAKVWGSAFNMPTNEGSEYLSCRMMYIG